MIVNYYITFVWNKGKGFKIIQWLCLRFKNNSWRNDLNPLRFLEKYKQVDYSD